MPQHVFAAVSYQTEKAVIRKDYGIPGRLGIGEHHRDPRRFGSRDEGAKVLPKAFNISLGVLLILVHDFYRLLMAGFGGLENSQE